MYTKDDIIQKLKLEPLPGEGGYFRETYRNHFKIDAVAAGMNVAGSRNVSTAIYYCIAAGEFSALHRLKSDEVFHFYSGDPVEMVQISEDGIMSKIIIGSDVITGQIPQIVVPAGVWQGTRLREGGKWALLGTTMAPAFEFADFELGERKKLLAQWPQFTDEIIQLTRDI